MTRTIEIDYQIIYSAIKKHYEQSFEKGYNCGKYVPTSTIAHWAKIPTSKALRIMKKLNIAGRCRLSKYSGICTWHVEIEGWIEHSRWDWCVVPTLNYYESN